ncbi:MAG: hypothetical protein K5771_02825 [Oscillospiraceae bacterium]|nr:hypothetical protein [Oscillospiraceae bacterium]
MKRIVSFLLLLTSFIMILTMPATEVTPVQHTVQPLPVWSILLYVSVVLVTMVAVMLMKRGKEAEPEMA